jgi:uncharacterized membrane protein
MEPIIVLALLLLAAIFILPIMALVKASGAAQVAHAAFEKSGLLERQLERLERKINGPTDFAPPQPQPKPVEPVIEKAPEKAAAKEPEPPVREWAAPQIAPPVFKQPETSPAPAPLPMPKMPEPEARKETPAAHPRASSELSPDELEQFMGVKLFAWIGGIALFLAVAFFVKYSFEHDLIPAWLRIATGYVIGAGLVGGGLAMRRKDYAVTSQTLCATGVLSLYGVTFASHAIYHFAGNGLTFAIMTAITAGAFLLAVRMDAAVIAVLGIAGGFITPLLLSSGQDNPFGLFSYLALLNAGLLAVALRREWNFLAVLGTIGTLLMEAAWLSAFFVRSEYEIGARIFIPMGVLLLFPALYFGATWLGRKREMIRAWFAGSGLVLAAAAFIFAATIYQQTSIAQRPWTLFGFLFVADVLVLAFALIERKAAHIHLAAGGFIFILLACWINEALSHSLLFTALGMVFIFTAFHTLAPLALKRLRGIEAPWWCNQIFPLFGILLVLIPVSQLPSVPLGIWPVLFLFDAVAFVLAMLSGVIFGAVAAVVLTFIAMWILLGHVTSSLAGLPAMLFITGVFTAIFFIATAGMLRRRQTTSETEPEPMWSQFPVFVVLMPFALMILIVAQFPLQNPSPVFALALCLVALLMLAARWQRMDWLPLVGLGAVWALEALWQQQSFSPAHWGVPFGWHVVFYALFIALPFLCQKAFRGKTLPWDAAALSGPLHFWLVYRLTLAAAPQQPWISLLPAAFAVAPLLTGLALRNRLANDEPSRLPILARQFGVALGFATLVIALQLHRENLTIGWALEGVALCWLFRRLPHPGLRVSGLALLAVSFLRLTINPAVLEYHDRAALPILNWYLYAYGLVIAAFIIAARLLAPPRDQIGELRLPPILKTLGSVLGFLLLNLEIADFFTPAGAPVLTFDFAANLGRDMTYSIAWAFFALALVINGLIRRSAPSRYAGLALLSVTVAKLFFHDLSALGQLYRIGALFAVAVIAMFSSFLYQRFLKDAKQGER